MQLKTKSNFTMFYKNTMSDLDEFLVFHLV